MSEKVEEKKQEKKQTEAAKPKEQVELEKQVAEAQSKIKNMTELCLGAAAYLDEVQMKMGEMQTKINKLRVDIFTSLAGPAPPQNS